MNRPIAIGAAAIVAGCSLASTCPAFDASSPPDPITVEWTQEFLSAPNRELVFEKTTAGQILEFAASSMNFSGFYIEFEFETVNERLNRPLKINFKEVNWLQVLGRVADTLEADLIIGRGVIRFVPRDQRRGSWEKRFDNERKQSPKKPKPAEGDPFEQPK